LFHCHEGFVTSISKLLVTTAMLLMLTACSGETHHASLTGTPDNWWSDNYLAMWQQDAQDASAGIGTSKAKPLTLPK
jgi:hypothetical protein